MEVVKFMKKKVAEGNHQMNVNHIELNKLKELKTEGYLKDIKETYLEDGTYDVMFVPTEKFKDL